LRQRGEWPGLSATELTVIANSDVDGGAAPDLPAGEQRLSEDLRDVEWARRAPLIPPALPGGRPRTDMRAAMNAILYLLRSGCPWRYLPLDSFPPRSTVYNIFRKLQCDGVWEAISAELHMASREGMGREVSLRRRFSTASRSNRPKKGR
jgi:transposase